MDTVPRNSYSTTSGTFLMVHLLGVLSVWDGQVRLPGGNVKW